MLLAEIVATSAAVGATRSRKAKVQLLAAVLRRLAGEEVAPAVGWLAGEPRQGRTGTGWRTLAAVSAGPAAEPTLTVAGVDATLDALLAATGPGSVARRAELLGGLLGTATTDEQDFLRRLLVGELRHGALEGVLVEAVAAAAGVPAEQVRRALMLAGELPTTAHAALIGGAGALAAFRLQVGRGVKPMLASPADDLNAALAELGEQVSVEYKLDGARIQVHREGAEVRVFTRSLHDITAAVPELVELARSLPCRSVVLDGESLALTDADDPQARPRPFQESMSNASAGLLRPRFFDCLHLDGADLLDAPLRERLAALTSVADEHRMPGVLTPTGEAAAALLAAALDAGHEGVMVKSLDAPYAAGRRGRSWQKVKPVHTLDLVVLAAEWGYGRRTGWLSNIHLGARDPDGGPPIMVGKTFKGMTDALLAWQTETFSARALSDDGHVARLPPEFVVEIELDGVQVSRRYPGGVALRFARVQRYRPDKIPAQADTIDAVRALLRS
ncbi:MAG: ATP-dependent DNA ligase [Pseudonocardia sp.]